MCVYIYIYTKILEVNLFAFAYRLFRRDFSPLDGTYCNIKESTCCQSMASDHSYLVAHMLHLSCTAML